MTKLTKEQEEKLRKNWSKTFQPPEMIYLRNPDNKLSCPMCGVKAEEIADWWVDQINQILQDSPKEECVHEYNQDKWNICSKCGTTEQPQDKQKQIAELNLPELNQEKSWSKHVALTLGAIADKTDELIKTVNSLTTNNTKQ